jgi:hypothetical protein
VKQINVMAFQLKLLGFMRIYHVFHVSLLEPYHAFTIPKRIHDPPPPIKVDGEQKYKVKDILNSRIFNCQFQYLIHWHGYDVSEHIWEPIKNLSNVMEKVHEFHYDIQTNPNPFLVELIIRKGDDVTNVSIRHHLPIDGIHP